MRLPLSHWYKLQPPILGWKVGAKPQGELSQFPRRLHSWQSTAERTFATACESKGVVFFTFPVGHGGRCFICGGLLGPALLETVEEDGAEQDGAAGHILVERRDVFEIHGVLDDAHDEDARDDEAERAHAAGERNAAQ